MPFASIISLINKLLPFGIIPKSKLSEFQAHTIRNILKIAVRQAPGITARNKTIRNPGAEAHPAEDIQLHLHARLRHKKTILIVLIFIMIIMIKFVRMVTAVLKGKT